MSKSEFDANHQQSSLINLIADLKAIGTQSLAGVDEEMLSLLVDEARKGIDISRRYPAFYQNILANADLRQAFTDVLEALEMEERNEHVPLPNPTDVNLDFLTKASPQPVLELLDHHQWRIRWAQTFEKIEAIFSPVELVYRLDPILLDDPWFTLLKEDFEIASSLYSIVLDCTLAKDHNALTPYLRLAITLGSTIVDPPFPILAHLEWGSYNASIPLSEAGRIRLPDIPLNAVFDDEFYPIEVEFNFSLATLS